MSKKFAVFDIDGTLIRWQLYHAIVNRLAAKGEISKESYEKIRRARMAWKNRTRDNSFNEYENTLVQQWLAESSKLDYQQYLKAVNEIVSEYINQSYTYTRGLVKKLKARGYFLLTISGSPEEAVKLVAEHYGFDDFVAAHFVRNKAGRFTGKNKSPVFDKAKTLKQMVRKHNLTWQDSVAVGDTASDIAILELVEHPIAFNPEKQLVKTAIDRGWSVIVERKNVVYEFKDGNWRI